MKDKAVAAANAGMETSVVARGETGRGHRIYSVPETI